MSDSWIAKTLRDTDEAIRRSAASVAADATDFAARLNLRSLLQRQSQLQDEFANELAVKRASECRIHFYPNLDGMPVLVLSNLLDGFQQCFQFAYRAFKSGPNDSNSTSPGIASEAELLFSHSFAGSVGISLISRPSIDLIDDYSQAFEFVREASSIDSENDVRKLDQATGKGFVRRFSHWLRALEESSTWIEVDWKSKSRTLSLSLRETQIKKIKDLIENTAFDDVTEFSGTFKLLAIDTIKRTFRAVQETTDPPQEIRGDVARSISLDDKITVNCEYQMEFRCITRTRFADGDTPAKVRFELLKLTLSSGL